MTSMMIRRSLTAAVALAALAAVALAPMTLAEARPEGSPFAGTYDWGSWLVTVSNNGQIRGSTDEGSTKVTLSGRVNDDGSYSLTVDVSFLNPEWGPRDKRRWIRTTYESAGNLTLNDDGDIAGTPDSGGFGSFVWLRR